MSFLPYRAPYNKYLEAINQVEKGLLDAAAMRQSRRIAQRHAARLKSAVVEATQNREYVYARKMLGHTIYATLLGMIVFKSSFVTKPSLIII